MDPEDPSTRATELPDAVVRYGAHADAIIDLHLPPRDGFDSRESHPLVVFFHGGFWRTAYDRTHTRPLTRALAKSGFVVATPEYRRVGGDGRLAGGWPTTFEDVSAAMEALPRLLEELGIRVSRTTVMGHSAGGQLALWLANEPYAVDRAVGLAPVGDLRAGAVAHLGNDAVRELLEGSPTQVPERYDAADPATRLHDVPSCEVMVIHGVADDVVPIDNSRGLHAAHPFVAVRALEGIDHYQIIDPWSSAWPVVRAAASAEPLIGI